MNGMESIEASKATCSIKNQVFVYNQCHSIFSMSIIIVRTQVMVTGMKELRMKFESNLSLEFDEEND